MDEQQLLLVKLARGLARTRSEATLPIRLCAVYRDLMGADGGSISMDFATTDRVVLCATDARNARIEDAQDVVREGPSLDAFRTGVAVTGLSTAEQERRWPMLAEFVDANFSQTALHAFPIMPEGRVVGVLLVYRVAVRQLALRIDQAQFLANAIGIALLGELGSDSLTDESWSARDRMDQATGMVCAQLHVAEGFANMTALAVVTPADLPVDRLAARVTEAIQSRSLVEQAKGVLAQVHSVDLSTAYDLLVDHARNGVALTSAAREVLRGQYS